MTEPENVVPNSSELSDLKQECAELRRVTNMLLWTLIVTSLTLGSFLLMQARRTGKDLQVVMQQEAQVRETNKKEKPALDAVLTKLVAYGQTHPDFAAILAKYPFRAATNAVTPSSTLPGATPVPAIPK